MIKYFLKCDKCIFSTEIVDGIVPFLKYHECDGLVYLTFNPKDTRKFREIKNFTDDVEYSDKEHNHLIEYMMTRNEINSIQP